MQSGSMISGNLPRLDQLIADFEGEVIVTNHPWSIVYPGQVPNLGFLLLSGEVTVKCPRTKSTEVRQGPVWLGVEEILAKTAVSDELTLSAGAKVCLIDRNHILNSWDRIKSICPV